MNALPTTPLGTTGMDITRVGFGSWAVAGSGWRFGWGLSSNSRRRPKGGRAASGACSRRAGWKPAYWTYSAFRPVRRERVPDAARQTGV
ncbi:hypothetical protein [Streptomyces sp. NBC_01264]|uniref:hypothetical protein n=1 Tax=Streptomyces sp. NBC_01264 TaxID=2903804 RepID=UPI00224DDC78|nr:hypothetical protein [Streptomyces sp. NBC_01264]MCX4780548.1 hypothetical protein [Streptomyces sp. NBC_01264]